METRVVTELPVPRTNRRNPLMVVIDQSKGHGPQPTTDWRLQLANELQASLEVPALLESFSDRVTDFLPLSGMSIANEALMLSLQIGEQSNHLRAYRLMIGAEHLGDVSMYTRRAVSPSEAELLEELVAALLYPLRNAIAYRQAVKAAALDPLTQVNNRANLDSMLNREIGLARRYETDLSLLMLDIDHFKEVNDAFGHLAGDVTLREVARTVVNCTRDSDAVYRFGGEEFCVLLSNTNSRGASRLAERIRAAVQDLDILAGDHNIKVTVSLGVADLESEDDALRLIDRADRALYRSKRDGRNLVTVSV